MPRRRREGKYSAGRWRIERERSRIADPLPELPFRDSVPVSKVISELLPRLQPAHNPALLELVGDWETIVGKAIAKHTRPGRVDNTCLVVYVTNSVWLDELARHSRPAMLEKVQQRVGPERVSDIRLYLDPDSGRPS